MGRRSTGKLLMGSLRRVGIWLASTALLLGSTAALQAAPAQLTLGVADSGAYAAPVLIADAQGYFAAEGLALKVVRCAFGRICLQKLLDGELHFATVADTPIVFASFTRHDFAVVATITTSGRETQMVVRGDRGIRGPADLKGKRIGMLKGTSGHYFTESFLLFHGVNMADVTLVPLDARDVVGPLVRGEIDAAGLFQPHVLNALRQLGANGATLPGGSFFSLGFNIVSVGEAAGASDEDVQKLLRAVRRADALIRSEPEQARKIVAAALKLDVRELAASWGDFDYRTQLGQGLVNSLESQARWAMRAGLVPAGSRLPDYLDYVRTEPLRRVDPHAVRLVH